MYSNLDVLAIQFYPDELYTALSQIKDGLNIIYSNCLCDFRIGNQYITNKSFDTILYNETSDILIMLSKQGKASKDDMVKYLEENNKRYAEITFSEEDELEVSEDNIKELWFAREEYVLEDAVKDSISKDNITCDIYPLIDGDLSFNYMSNKNEKFPIDGRIFQGLIEFDDKIVLIINQKDNIDELGNSRNLALDKIIKVLDNNDINYNISDKKDINLDNSNNIKMM